ncbi:hypothetical protein CCUS01_01887 [Colletotrichum cuscutae]|uniref:Uncharacterized protein n=1 Tax=Colletotrichum cuscutae TaxID=1209917 RepID=A0AAI9U6Y7_9PEZI|nr:hypothetical protein CCUS01_01887 [Colletotrichum cuscutae]
MASHILFFSSFFSLFLSRFRYIPPISSHLIPPHPIQIPRFRLFLSGHFCLIWPGSTEKGVSHLLERGNGGGSPRRRYSTFSNERAAGVFRGVLGSTKRSRRDGLQARRRTEIVLEAGGQQKGDLGTETFAWETVYGVSNRAAEMRMSSRKEDESVSGALSLSFFLLSLCFLNFSS